MLVEQLKAKGFEDFGTGGNCRALVKFDKGITQVVTDTEGLSLPEDDDWMLGVYDGDWRERDDCACISNADIETSPVSLLDLLDWDCR